MRPILVAILVPALFPALACSQEASARAERWVYENSAGGLRWQLQDMLNAARDGNAPKLEFLIRRTEISNYTEWFTKTFGQEKGKEWAGSYALNLAGNEKSLESLLIGLAGEDGEFVSRKMNRDPAPARKNEGEMVGALQQPVDIFFATWKKLGQSSDSDPTPVGYFVFMDGIFRLQGAVSAAETPPRARLDAGSAQTNSLPHQANAPPDVPKTIGVNPAHPGVGGIGYPSCDYCPDPSYTKVARKRHLEGAVVLQAVVQADGSLTDIQVVKSPDPELTEMALDGVARWHLNPARRADGEPVPVIVPIEVNFRLLR